MENRSALLQMTAKTPSSVLSASKICAQHFVSVSPSPLSTGETEALLSKSVVTYASGLRVELKVRGSFLELKNWKAFWVVSLHFAQLEIQELADKSYAVTITTVPGHASQTKDIQATKSRSHGTWIVIVQTAEKADDLVDLLAVGGAIRPNLFRGGFTVGRHRLGTGGQADVFKATKVEGSGNTAMALKVIRLPPGRDESRGPPSCMKSEVAMLAEVQGHANIVSFYGAACLPHPVSNVMSWAITMELCVGGDLRDFVSIEPMEDAAARTIFSGVLSALEFIHKRGIIHRDVKCENILLAGEDRRPVLTDFGLACRLDDSARMKDRVGTPGYQPPEVLQGQRYGTKVDLFAAGCALFVMFTGRNPWGQSKEERCKNTLENEVWRDDPELECSGECMDLMGKLMAKSQDQRLSAAEALKHVWLGSSVADRFATASSGDVVSQDGPAETAKITSCTRMTIIGKLLRSGGHRLASVVNSRVERSIAPEGVFSGPTTTARSNSSGPSGFVPVVPQDPAPVMKLQQAKGGWRAPWTAMNRKSRSVAPAPIVTEAPTIDGGVVKPANKAWHRRLRALVQI